MKAVKSSSRKSSYCLLQMGVFFHLCYGFLIWLPLPYHFQMYYWQSSLSSVAADSPVQLETTRKILQLLSAGQFVPPPLDGVAEIIDILHPFHLHCILVDIWNYVRDNVPSPGELLPY